jgi:ABC-2 type transport system ATP-binding protein
MIAVESLSKRYGSITAVDGLTFSVPSGSILGFLGPNGAGKTTTLRILLGLAAPTSGSATIDGQSYGSLSGPIGHVGAVLDSSGFHPGRKGGNHVRVMARAAGLPASRADEVLRMVGMGGAAGMRVKAYSLGMKQRLNLAAALLGDPHTLVLDEPANGLDPQGIRWLRDFLRSMAGEGRTVLISSHVLAEVSQTVDEVVVIHRGRLRAHSTLAELTRRRQSDAVRVRSPEAGRLAELLRSADASVEAAGGDRLAVRNSTPEQVGDLAAENGIALHELVAEHADASLEEAFLELTSDREVGGVGEVGGQAEARE